MRDGRLAIAAADPGQLMFLDEISLGQTIDSPRNNFGSDR